MVIGVHGLAGDCVLEDVTKAPKYAKDLVTILLPKTMAEPVEILVDVPGSVFSPDVRWVIILHYSSR